MTQADDKATHRLRRRCVLAAGSVSLLTARRAHGQQAAEPISNPLAGLRPGHPRILASARQLQAAARQADPVARQLQRIVRRDANAALQAPAIAYAQSHGHTQGTATVALSRELQRRVFTLAMAHRLFGERRHADAAIALLMQLAALDDWGSWHFLAVGEAAMAAAVGYDWLFDVMSEAQRSTLAQAIVDKALLPSLAVKDEPGSWLRGNFNWNPVCHGGLLAAALAVADRTPELAGRIVARAVHSLPHAAAEYADGGAYPEGPSYWSYGTTYYVLALETLRSALGHSFGLEKLPGFLQTGDYKLHMRGATGREFSFSDYHADGIDEPVMLWFARELQRPELALQQVREIERIVAGRSHPGGTPAGAYSRFTPLALLWWQSAMVPRAAHGALPLQWSARGALPISVMRSAWDAPKATCVVLKGGRADVSHGHMDMGSFMLEAQGVRWAVDPGREDYDRMRAAKLQLWRYAQDSTRWSAFRLGPEGHNILRFNGLAPRVDAVADVHVLRAGALAPGAVGAVADLSALYANQAAQVQRQVQLLADGNVQIDDRWTAGEQDVIVTFQWLTEARVQAMANGFMLQQGGQALRVDVSPASAKISVEDVSAARAPQDSANPGLSRVIVTLATPAGAQGGLRVMAAAQRR